MKWSGFASASGRRSLVGLGLAAVLGAATNAYAQAPAQTPPAGQAPAAAAPAQADPFKFTTPAAAVLWQVKPESTADFETVWTTLLTKLSAADKPELKAIGDNLKVYKVDGPVGPQGVTYILHVDPASSASSYSPTELLYYAQTAAGTTIFTREEADGLYKRLQSASNSINPLPLQKIK